MTPEQLAIVMMVLIILMVICGIPLAFAMMALAIAFGLTYRGMGVFPMFTSRIFGGVMQNEAIIAVPLFVFMGLILERSGAADKVYESLHELLGPVRGGLAIATIVVSTVFAACTAVIAASVTTMALVALPSMLKRGYSKALSTGVICAGGSLGILIPPSVMLVIYGPMANLSVARLFAAALFPGLLLATLYLIYVLLACGFSPQMGPALSHADRTKVNSRLLMKTVVYLLPILFLVVAVLGAILGGISTATEASALGTLAAMVVAAGYRKLSWKTIKESAYETLKVTSMVLFVIVGAAMFTAVFLALHGDTIVTSLITGIALNKWFILSIMMFIIFVLGMFIDWIGILYIIIPIFLPIATTIGFDPLWFALLICVNLQMSFLTPPFAYAIFFVLSVAPKEVTTRDVYKGVIPFISLQLVGLTLCIAFPEIILWLPKVTLGS